MYFRGLDFGRLLGLTLLVLFVYIIPIYRVILCAALVGHGIACDAYSILLIDW